MTGVGERGGAVERPCGGAHLCAYVGSPCCSGFACLSGVAVPLHVSAETLLLPSRPSTCCGCRPADCLSANHSATPPLRPSPSSRDGLVLIINPQWVAEGNVVSDLGFLPWQRKANEDFIASFQEVSPAPGQECLFVASGGAAASVSCRDGPTAGHVAPLQCCACWCVHAAEAAMVAGFQPPLCPRLCAACTRRTC